MGSLISNTKFAKTMEKSHRTSEAEHKFLKECIGLCISRMRAEHLDDRGYTDIRISCITAGMVICSFINKESHNGILFHVYYEGNHVNGRPLYAVPIHTDPDGEYVANTIDDAVIPVFEIM